MHEAIPPLLKCLIMLGVATGINLPYLFYMGKSLRVLCFFLVITDFHQVSLDTN